MSSHSQVQFRLNDNLTVTTTSIGAREWFKTISQFAVIAPHLSECGHCGNPHPQPNVRVVNDVSLFEIRCPECSAAFALDFDSKTGGLRLPEFPAWIREESLPVQKSDQPETEPNHSASPKEEAKEAGAGKADSQKQSKREELKYVMAEGIGCQKAEDYELIVWWATEGKYRAEHCRAESIAKEVLDAIDHLQSVRGVGYGNMLDVARTEKSHAG